MNEVEDQRSAEAGIPTAPQRRRGRRPTRPWERLEVTVTLQLIHNTWHTLALGLAQEDAVPEAAFIRMMTRARSHLNYGIKRVPSSAGSGGCARLTSRERRRLAELAQEQENRPGQEWAETEEDKKLAKEFTRLREKLHGRKTAREIDLSLTGGSTASSVARIIIPRRLKGLWKAFDMWGAVQFGIGVKTFRDWRRYAVAADKRLPEKEQMLRPLWRREAPTAERHRARVIFGHNRH